MTEFASDVLMWMVDHPQVPFGILSLSILVLIFSIIKITDRAPEHDTTENQVGNIR